MKIIHKRPLFTALLIVAGFASAFGQDASCTRFSTAAIPDKTEAPVLLAYLKSSSEHSWACDWDALRRLREIVFTKDVPGKEAWIETLIPYLAFKTGTSSGGRTFYPGWDILQRIGPAVITPMLKVVEAPETPVTTRSLAAGVLVSQGDLGFRAMIDASKKAPSSDVAHRFAAAAQDGLRFAGSPEKRAEWKKLVDELPQ